MNSELLLQAKSILNADSHCRITCPRTHAEPDLTETRATLLNHTWSLPLCIQIISQQIPGCQLYSQNRRLHRMYKIHIVWGRVFIWTTQGRLAHYHLIIVDQSLHDSQVEFAQVGIWLYKHHCDHHFSVPVCHDFHGKKNVPITVAWPQADWALVTLVQGGAM